MTQRSYLWLPDVGDGAASPWDASTEWSRAIFAMLGSLKQGGVHEGVLDECKVRATSPSSRNLEVLAGGAFVGGLEYYSDAITTITIAENATGNPRIDLVVLRADYAAQTVRVQVVQGTPAALPAVPALTQTFNTTWEIALAEVWVANGFATIEAYDLNDRRDFNYDYRTALSAGPSVNLVPNGELMLLDKGVPDYEDPWVNDTQPSHWSIIGGNYIRRGTGCALRIRIDDHAGEGIRCTQINVRPSTTYTVRCFANCVNGTTEINFAVTDNGAGATTETIRFWAASDYRQLTIRHTTQADSTRLDISFTRGSGGDFWLELWLRNVVCVEGMFPGPIFRRTHEYIYTGIPGRPEDLFPPFRIPWTNVTQPTGWYFDGGCAFPHIMAAFMVISNMDSGSAGAAEGSALVDVCGSYTTYPPPDAFKLRLRGTTNSRPRAGCFTLSDRRTYTSGDYKLIRFTPATSMDGEMWITGVAT